MCKILICRKSYGNKNNVNFAAEEVVTKMLSLKML